MLFNQMANKVPLPTIETAAAVASTSPWRPTQPVIDLHRYSLIIELINKLPSLLMSEYFFTVIECCLPYE